MNRIILSALLTAAILSAGCNKRRKHNPPPLERVSLTVRFFDSVSKRNSAAAVRQGRKIYALDPNQEYLLRLISIHESNEAVRSAQRMLRAGKVGEALKIVSRAVQDYPHNLTLKSTYPKLIQLRNAEKLLSAMDRAKNSSSMRGARIAARAGLSQNLTPEFSAYLQAYEEREKAVAEQEKKATQANLEAVKAAAERDRAADAKREAENVRFMEEMAKKTEAGEKMRQEAGEVPFDPNEKKNGENASASPKSADTPKTSEPSKAPDIQKTAAGQQPPGGAL